jgi:hypothetical protein
MEFACKELESGVSARDLLAVAMRSAEFDAANQVLYKRAKLEDIAFTPVVLMWPEGGPDAETNH